MQHPAIHPKPATILGLVTVLWACGCPGAGSAPDAGPPAGPATNPVPGTGLPDVTRKATFEDAGAMWVAGTEPWFSVGADQTLWKWVGFRPTRIAEGIHVRSGFSATSDPRMLAIDGLLLDATKPEETPPASRPGLAATLGTYHKQGYEQSEAVWTDDLTTFVTSRSFRSPRGIPVIGPDGEKGYRYEGPTEPAGAKSFVVALDAATGDERIRIDTASRSLATSRTHIGFTCGHRVVMIDRAGWTKTEIDLGASVAYLAMNDGFFAAVGRDRKAFCYRLADGAFTACASWETPDDLAFVRIHPTRPLVATGHRDDSVALWVPSEKQPVFTFHAARRAAFHGDGRHFIVAAAGDRDRVELFELSFRAP